MAITKKASASKRRAAESQRVKKTSQNELPAKSLPNAFRIVGLTISLLKKHWIIFGLLALIYGALSLALVQGFSGSGNVTDLKQSLDTFFAGHFASLVSSVTVYAVLVGSVGGSSTGNGAFQLVITLILSLAIIWTLRHVKAGSKVKLKDAFYKGMYPLIPFLLIVLVILLQLLPLIIGSAIYSVAMASVVVQTWERIIWVILYGGLAIWSGYMLSSSIFALYIVTLPDMTPLAALKSAKNLVKGRRWSVVRKLLFLPVALLLGAALIMVPIILVAVPASRWVFFILTCLSIVIVHTYLYTLYRELVDD